MATLALFCGAFDQALAQDEVHGGIEVAKFGTLTHVVGTDYTVTAKNWIGPIDVLQCWEEYNILSGQTLAVDSAVFQMYYSAYTLMDTTGTIEMNVTPYLTEYNYNPVEGPIAWNDSSASNYNGTKAGTVLTDTDKGFVAHNTMIVAPDDNVLRWLWFKIEYDSVNADPTVKGVSTVIQWNCLDL